MKRANNLLEEIADINNIMVAFCKARKGKNAKNETIEFQMRTDIEFNYIRKRMLDGTIKFGDYNFFKVYDPKERNICAATFRDRVIHHSIMNICEKYFENRMICNSFACRKNKGSHKAVSKCQEYSVRNRYYMKMDIKKYFDSINHDILKDMLKKIFKDKILISIFDKLINSYETEKGAGLPIGNLTSQYFANYYLTYLDKYITENLKHNFYIRYMDDFIIFSNDKKLLKQELTNIRFFLKNKLNLTLKENVMINATNEGLNFLGYKIYPNIIRLMKKSKQRFIKKIKNYRYNYKSGSYNETDIARRLNGIFNFLKYADTLNLRKKVLASYDFE